MEREYDFSFRGLANALQGRPYYGEELSADPVHVFQHLRGLQEQGITGRLTNYAWIPQNKKTIVITPQEAAKLFERKILKDTIKGAREFEIDHFVYWGKSGKERHVIELYAAYTDSRTNKKKRLYGKVMKLELLIHP